MSGARATGSAVWIGSLIRRFPDLVQEPARGARDGPVSAPDSGPAHPAGPHLADAVRDITDGVTELEEAVRERLGLRPVAPAPVPVRLRRVAGLLERIARDPLLAAHVEEEARRMAARCARALGDPEPSVRLPGRCPRCGAASLRAFPERNEVRCADPVCGALPDDGTDRP
ncbi:hypothetical protein ACFYQQ_17100 [Streptomyces sp. NPDC005496]|uniref:hypothetical protein n=1 Tax=Streptomyces sp. NPDC005496 TaxID=3364716 RepID=UPI00369A8AB6